LSDGSVPTPDGGPIDGRVERDIRITGRAPLASNFFYDVPSKRPDLFPDVGKVEVFSLRGDDWIQLTNFGLWDTRLMGARSDASVNAVLLMASADPLGLNPFENCQLFRVSTLGTRLRQLTRFGHGVRSQEGCFFGELPGCGIYYVEPIG